MTDTTDLADAIADLDPLQRHAFKVAMCEQRDRSVAEGQHALARVWNELAVTTAAAEDAERSLLRALEESMSRPPEEPSC